jgi:hypothetical protein
MVRTCERKAQPIRDPVASLEARTRSAMVPSGGGCGRGGGTYVCLSGAAPTWPSSDPFIVRCERWGQEEGEDGAEGAVGKKRPSWYLGREQGEANTTFVASVTE